MLICTGQSVNCLHLKNRKINKLVYTLVQQSILCTPEASARSSGWEIAAWMRGEAYRKPSLPVPCTLFTKWHLPVPSRLTAAGPSPSSILAEIESTASRARFPPAEWNQTLQEIRRTCKVCRSVVIFGSCAKNRTRKTLVHVSLCTFVGHVGECGNTVEACPSPPLHPVYMPCSRYVSIFSY